MKTSYHCTQCDKEFLDPSIANNHRNTTGHNIIERSLEA